MSGAQGQCAITQRPFFVCVFEELTRCYVSPAIYYRPCMRSVDGKNPGAHTTSIGLWTVLELRTIDLTKFTKCWRTEWAAGFEGMDKKKKLKRGLIVYRVASLV